MQQRYNQRGPGGGGGAGTPGGGGSGFGSANEIAALLKPPATLPRYFSDNTKTPRKELLDSEADQTAKELATLPASQLRRFYAEIMALKRRLDLDRDHRLPDDEIAAQLALLKAKAAYTWARRKNCPNELVLFFTRHAAAVRTREDFMRGFQPHFEAVIAYHRVYEQKKGDSD